MASANATENVNTYHACSCVLRPSGYKVPRIPKRGVVNEWTGKSLLADGGEAKRADRPNRSQPEIKHGTLAGRVQDHYATNVVRDDVMLLKSSGLSSRNTLAPKLD